MLRIGEFSQLAQVTVKTLHYYEEIGLLSPVYVDPSTGYRYYDMEQLPKAHRIMALKDLGFSLDQIAGVLEDDPSEQRVRQLLRSNLDEIDADMQKILRRKSLIDFRLRMLESEASFPNLDVKVKRLDPIHCLSVFVPPPTSWEEAPQEIERGASLLSTAIANGSIHHNGITIDKFFDLEPVGPRSFQFSKHEILLGVEKDQQDVYLEELGQLSIKREDAVETALTLTLSSREEGHSAALQKVTTLQHWAAAHGYQTIDYVRLSHYRGPLDTQEMDDFLFEAQLPVEDITA